jgi:hypothetical protein
MTALMATGDFKGGHLVIPRWGIAIVLRPGDLLLFDAEELHGNLEMKSDRLSFAFYCASMRRLLKKNQINTYLRRFFSRENLSGKLGT